VGSRHQPLAPDGWGKVTGTGVDIHTTTPLAMHQGLFVDVAFDKGSVRPPTAFDLLILFRYNWPLLVLIIAFLISLWRWWTRAERQFAKKIEQIEVKAEQQPEKSKDAWDQQKLEAYFSKNLSHVGLIFVIAIAAMGVGFMIMMTGVILAIANPDSIKTSSLVAFSGIITEVIGATFMAIYRYTMAQANQYVEVLKRINTVGRAEKIMDAIPESELKNKTRAEIAGLLLSVNVWQKPDESGKKWRR
jgi:hypothetical protein